MPSESDERAARLQRLVDQHNDRARAYQLPATLTVAEWLETAKHFQGKCAYCQTAKTEVIDRFVPLCEGGGTTAGNCLPACRACDWAKSTRHPADALTPEQYQRLSGYLEARSSGADMGQPIPPPWQAEYEDTGVVAGVLAEFFKSAQAEVCSGETTEDRRKELTDFVHSVHSKLVLGGEAEPGRFACVMLGALIDRRAKDSGQRQQEGLDLPSVIISEFSVSFQRFGEKLDKRLLQEVISLWTSEGNTGKGSKWAKFYKLVTEAEIIQNTVKLSTVRDWFMKRRGDPVE